MLFVLAFSAFIYCEPSLQQRYERIVPEAEKYGGADVLVRARDALAKGNYTLITLEDLWTTALQEGKNLFHTKNLWGMTGPSRTKDMLGQTTVGPWQITTANAIEYGKKYGLKSADELANDPEMQARIAADFIEESYQKYGKRNPLAIQRYFWLQAFVNKQIGQGPWYESVLPGKARSQKQTGFYAKQVLLGSQFNSKGLLYWLHVTGDEDAIREAIKTWREAGYPVSAADVPHCKCDPQFQRYLLGLL